MLKFSLNILLIINSKLKNVQSLLKTKGLKLISIYHERNIMRKELQIIIIDNKSY